jgi:hypothetical protein
VAQGKGPECKPIVIEKRSQGILRHFHPFCVSGMVEPLGYELSCLEALGPWGIHPQKPVQGRLNGVSGRRLDSF